MKGSRTGRRSAGVVATASIAAIAVFGLSACGSSKTSAGAPTGATPSTGGAAGTLPSPQAVSGTLSGPGVTADTITLGQITTTSGPIPGLWQGANDGLDAWAAYMNSHGGIAGHQIKILHSDDALDCNTYTTALKQDVGRVFAMVGTQSTEDACGQATLTANPNLPDLEVFANPALYSLPNYYGPEIGPPGWETTQYEYFKSRFPNDITHTAALEGAPGAYGAKEIQLTAESLGYKFVYTRLIQASESNFTSDILRMKADGVKIVDMSATAVTHVSYFLQQAAQQNFHPDVVIGNAGYDPHLFPLLGNSSLADKVLYAPLPTALYLGGASAPNPAVNTFLTWLDKLRSGVTPAQFGVEVWATGDLLVQAMHNAGPQITQTSVLSALSKITNFSDNGLIAPVNPGPKAGSHCVVIAEVVNGHWTQVDPPNGRFDCTGTFHSVPASQLK